MAVIRQLAVLGGGQEDPTPLRARHAGARERASMKGVWGAVSEELWPAWSGMLAAESRVYETFGEELGQKLLVLWAVSRFGDSDLSHGMLAELVDEQGRPRFGDWLVEDMLLAAFALGASWQARAGGPEVS